MYNNNITDIWSTIEFSVHIIVERNVVRVVGSSCSSFKLQTAEMDNFVLDRLYQTPSTLPVNSQDIHRDNLWWLEMSFLHLQGTFF